MESFAVAIPGAFTSTWGIDVWKRVSEVKRYDEDMDSRPNDPTLSTEGDAHLRVSVPSPPPLTQRTRRPFNLLRPLRRVIANDTPHDVALTQSLPRLLVILRHSTIPTQMEILLSTISASVYDT